MTKIKILPNGMAQAVLKTRIRQNVEYLCTKSYGLGGGFIKGQKYTSLTPETLHDEDGDNMYLSNEDFDGHFIDTSNPPLPYIGIATVGGVVSGEQVFQWMLPGGQWIIDTTIKRDGHDYGYFEYYYKMMSNDYETRQAWLIVEVKHPTLDEMVKHTMDRMPALDGLTQPEATSIEESLSVGEAAEISANLHVSIMKVQNPEFAIRLYQNGFKNGANWQKQQRNDEVVKVIESRMAELLNDHTKAVNQSLYNELTTLLSTLNKTT